MAQEFHGYDHLINKYQNHVGSGYCDPTVASLEAFDRWVTCEGRPGDDRLQTPPGMPSAYNESEFYLRKNVPRCLYDLAYVWLAEADAVRFCPTFDLWLTFLIAFADVTRHFADRSIRSTDMFALSQVDFFHDGDAEAELRDLGLLYRHPALLPDGVPSTGYADAGVYRHPALRRDIYDLCSADYHRRIRLH